MRLNGALAELLTFLIADFEEERYALKSSGPIEALNELMLANANRKISGKFSDPPGIASEVLSGKRKLSAEHIRRLTRRFKVSPEAFL